MKTNNTHQKTGKQAPVSHNAVKKSDYIILRDKTIDNITLNANNVYENDDEMLLGIKGLCNHLVDANFNKTSVDLVRGLAGWIHYCSQNITKIIASECLTNIIHDLGEFRKNKNEEWFSPRTESYHKFL